MKDPGSGTIGHNHVKAKEAQKMRQKMIGPKKRNLPRSQWERLFSAQSDRCDEKARNPKVAYIIGPWRQEFWTAKKTGSASSSLASALGITSGNRGPDFPEIASLFVFVFPIFHLGLFDFALSRPKATESDLLRPNAPLKNKSKSTQKNALKNDRAEEAKSPTQPMG